MKRIVLLIFAFLLPCIVLAADDDAAPPPIDALLHKSGLWQQIAQIEPLVQLGIDQGHQQSGSVDQEGLVRIKQAVAATFAADRLRQEVRSQLASALTPDEIGKTLAWLSSDLGQQLTALEEANSEASQYEARLQAATQFITTLPAKRRSLVEKLVAALGAGEASASMVINTTLALARGIAAVSPTNTAGDVDGLAAMLQGQRQQLARHYRREAIAQMAYTYRSVTDRDLNRYVGFATSPTGKKYHAATIAALDKALARAAGDIGKELTTPRKSAANTPAAPIVHGLACAPSGNEG